MATYKQRAPYQRHTASSRLSDEDDGAHPSSSHTSYVSASHSALHTPLHPSQHHGQHPQPHAQSYTTEDDFFDSASNLEWTSSRHSTSARAKARQQQYLDQQLQRTREWQSVLAQHRQAAATHLPFLTTAPVSGPAVVVQAATPLSATSPPTLPTPVETATIAQTRSSKSANSTRSNSAGPAISSDEFDDDMLTGSELPSGLASPRTADFGTPGLGMSSHAERLSTFGFSDLTSDGGLESVDESEDLGVWSQEDEEDDGMGGLSLYTPSFRRLSAVSLSSSTSSPLVLSSTTNSLSHLPRPSFALATASASPYTGVDLTKFQNQMPFHDGSGNFGAINRRTTGAMSSTVDESESFDSDSSRASSVLRAYRPRTPLMLRRRISSSEFQNVIRNIAELQQANDRQQLERYTIEMHQQQHRPAQRPHFIYPQIVPRRPIFNIYESEMEDLEEMVDDEAPPAKIGWLQAFEQTLRALHPNEYAVHVTDPTVINPIKALAYHYSREESSAPHKDTKQLSRSTEATTPSDDHSDARTSKESFEGQGQRKGETGKDGEGKGKERAEAEEKEEDSNTVSCRVEQVRQNMSSASLQTLQRLQERKRSNPEQTTPRDQAHAGHRLNRSDPMQVDFSPTIQHPPSPALVGMALKERRVLSRSTGTSTSHGVHDSNIIAVVISTLRRFRDHVTSNLLYTEFYDEYDSGLSHHPHQQQQHLPQYHQYHALHQHHQNDLSRSLGFDGDLGIEWSLRAAAAGESSLQQVQLPPPPPSQQQDDLRPESESSSQSHSRRQQQQHRRRPQSQQGHRSLSTSTSSSSLASMNMRRVSSDCGLESMRKGLKYRHPHPRSAHESNALVE